MADQQMSNYLSLFLLDMDEHLQTFEDGLLRLEKDAEQADSLAAIFRAAHSIKGASAAMGFELVVQMTHRMEDLLDLVRSGRRAVTSTLINVLFQCLDTLQAMRKVIGDLEELSQVEIEPVLKQLDQFLAGDFVDGIPAEAEETPNRRLFAVTIRLHDHVVLKAARFCIVMNQLSEIGDIAESFPDLTSDEEPVELKLKLWSEKPEDEIKAALIAHSEVAEAAVSMAHEQQPIQETKESSLVREEPASTSIASPAVNKKRAASSIRIDVECLEALMNTLSELVIYQTRNVQITGELANQFRGDGLAESLSENTSTMSKVISELQEHVIKTRMQPVETLFNRLPRMVRDISHSLGKDVEFVTEGGETELDRKVLEDIADPLIHILRNALDHGIENQEARAKLAKPAKARVTVRAAQQENHVTLSVTDDGRGIDPEKLKKSAIEKQVITAQEADKLTNEQAINLIFAPGFSTANAVTDISGRGIGMDIVRTHIEKINGIIHIDSQVGKGTCFQIKLPLTLAIIRGILFTLGDKAFALPMSNVLEIVNAQEQQVENAAGHEVFRYRESYIPIKWIQEEFGVPRAESDFHSMKLIVIGISEKRFAIPVSKLIGFQDIVVKPIGEQVKKKDIVSNATILGNGNVALILDAAGMYKSLAARS